MTTTNTETETHTLPGNAAFTTPRLPTGLIGCQSHMAFASAHAEVSSFIEQVLRIEADTDWSPTGRERQTAPLQSSLWTAVANAHAVLNGIEEQTDADEAALLRLPAVHELALAVAAEDGEARAWWRSQTPEERTKLLAAMGDDEATGHKFKRLQLALLRSPIPLPDHEVQFVRELWTQSCRLDNPGEALRIDHMRASVEWARTAVGHLQGNVARVTRWQREAQAEFLANGNEKAALKMGFSPRELAHGKAVAAARQGKRLA
ncbi:MAG TPA: hypothetical protein PLL92_07070 [Alicycliphilus sp.]|nr:hypothetical protein [Alicycliphilus sp.]